MTMLMTMDLCHALCQQVGHEISNANLYLYISGFLKNKGLDGLAKHFEGQWQEELGHAKEFFDLLTDLNAMLMIPEIDAMNIPFEKIIDIAIAYRDREILTTTSIEEIKKMAILENNPVVEQKMREMIAKQQKEYEEATTFEDKATLMPEWWQVALWDAAIK